jgi:hypothetical protein
VEENMSKITTRGLGSAAARNLKFVLVPALLACTSLTGCISSVTGTQHLVSAEALNLQPPNPPLAGSADKLEYLGRMVMDSETKCSAFVNGLVLNETSANTGLDILGTVASALSTAFVPPGTKTALSAAATIATGSKTAIDTDIYDKAAISDFSTAIQKTYSAGIKTYTDALPTLADTAASPLVVSNEVAKIQAIHALCALAPAEASIQSQLGGTTKAKSEKPQGALEDMAPDASGNPVANETHAPIWGSGW